MKTSFIVLPALFLSCPATGGEAIEAAMATDVARRFCELQETAAPAALSTLFTGDLARVVDDALARNRSIAESSGAAAAPLADGVPLRSMAETAPCAPAAVAISANLTIVDIEYAVANGRTWTDRLVLKDEDGKARIDDILFASFPTDTYNAGLRRVLADTFDQ